MTDKPPKIGITRAPGGLPALDAHVGAWLAFDEFGLRPAYVAGCSAGAIISAMQAAGMSALEARAVLSDLRSDAVIRRRPLWKARAFWLKHFLDPAPIAELLEDYLPDTFAELKLRLAVSATRMDSSPEHAVVFETGPLREAVLASMSIAGAWPYARVDSSSPRTCVRRTGNGGRYSDGATTDAIVLPHDINTFDHFFIVNIRRSCSFRLRDRNIISRLLWNVEQLMEVERNQAQVLYGTRGNAHVHWLDLDIADASTFKFRHSLQIDAYCEALNQLNDAGFTRLGHCGTVRCSNETGEHGAL